MEPISKLEKITTIVSELLGVPVEKITPDATFEQLGGDSLDTVEIIMELEEEFGIDIPDEAMEKIQTVGQAHEYIISKL